MSSHSKDTTTTSTGTAEAGLDTSSSGKDAKDSDSGGVDPNLVGEPNPKDKLTGTGAPGSHSAVFGLTPDGKSNTDTSKSSGGAIKPAHGTEEASGGGKESSGGDTGSRAPAGGGELSEQRKKTELEERS